MKEYKGQLKGFPSEIVEKMLEYQVAQGNPKNIGIFERNKYISQVFGGFLWEKTPERWHFWHRVIDNKDFDLFFERYPKQSWKKVFEGYPKMKILKEIQEAILSLKQLGCEEENLLIIVSPTVDFCVKQILEFAFYDVSSIKITKFFSVEYRNDGYENNIVIYDKNNLCLNSNLIKRIKI